MKKKILLIIMLLLVTGCSNNIESTDEGLSTWNFLNQDEEENIQVRKYIENDKRNIYLIGHEDLWVNYDKRLLSLRSYYDEQNKDIDKVVDEILAISQKDAEVEELEASIYGNDDGMVLVCHTSSGINDVYIAELGTVDVDWLVDNKLCGADFPVKIEGVSMKIKNNTLKNTGATIIITDKTDNKTYGTYYRIDKYENGRWEYLETADGTPLRNLQWNGIAYEIKNNRLELPIDWEKIYGSLEKGKYRLVKKYSDKFIGVEFEIK